MIVVHTRAIGLLVKCKRVMGTDKNIDLISNQEQPNEPPVSTGGSFGCVTVADSRWETDKWPVVVPVHCSHDVASIYK